MSQCPHLNIDYDDRNVRVCADCGEILDIHQLVNTYSYGEGAHGAYLEGQFMQIKGSHASNSASRQATIQKFQRHFKYVAEMLQLSDSLIERARKMYEVALQKQITQARKSSHVAAVLLAITCMQEGLPYLLIDFANIFQVNISELSSTFLDFTEKLQLTIPLQRPEVFVDRFCEQVYADIRDGRYDFEVGELSSQPSSSFGRNEKLELVKGVKQLVTVMQELGLHVQRKPQLLVGVALYLMLQYMGVYCCAQQLCEYLFMSRDALERAVRAVLANEYFRVTPVATILAESDVRAAVRTYRVVGPVNQAKRGRIATADGQNVDGYHTAQFMDDRPFTYFENGYIYEMRCERHDSEGIRQENHQGQQIGQSTTEAVDIRSTINVQTDLSALDAEVDAYLSTPQQAAARAELFDQLYRDDMLYYVERRRLRRTQGPRRRRRFHSLDASIQSVAQLPKDTRAQLSEVLRTEAQEQERSSSHDDAQVYQRNAQQLVNAVNPRPESSSDLYEEESQDGQQMILM